MIVTQKAAEEGSQSLKRVAWLPDIKQEIFETYQV